MNECGCGCGKIVKNKYALGHNSRIDNPSHRSDVNEKQKNSNIKTWSDNKLKIKHSKIMKEIANREYVKKLMIKNNPMNKLEFRIKSGKKISEYWKNHPDEKKNRDKKVGITLKNKWKTDKKFVKYMRQCCNIKPNKLENKLYKFLQKYGFKYTGDFSFWIDGKNPDFIIKNKKIFVELFGSYWHELSDESKRLKHFSEHGWTGVIIWDYEMKDIIKLKYKIGKLLCF